MNISASSPVAGWAMGCGVAGIGAGCCIAGIGAGMGCIGAPVSITGAGADMLAGFSIQFVTVRRG